MRVVLLPSLPDSSKQAEPIALGESSVRSGGDVVVTAISTEDNSSSGFPSTLRVALADRRLERSFDFGLNAQVLWSPDRTRFAVTGSEGGANGQFRTAVVSAYDVDVVAQRGTELSAAPDECIRSPRSCFVAANRPESKEK